MGRKFNKIAPDTPKQLLLGSAIIAVGFDPETGTLDESDMLGSSTGGIRVNITPEFADLGSDIDNCPKNTRELKEITDWSVGTNGTFVTINSRSAKMLVAAADYAGGKITPRMKLKDADFNNLWIIGSYSDSDDAFIAINLKNALNVDGFSIQTGDRAKGQFAFNFLAHYTMEKPDEIPFDIYMSEATSAAAAANVEEEEEANA